MQNNTIDRMKKAKTTDGCKERSHFVLFIKRFESKESIRWIRHGKLLQLHGCFDKTLKGKI